ncbi:hypothetical protein EON66_10330 [archaeon]|nr:MAG: hypothetical protein EON66_10330 [archaeon]
MTTVHTSVVHSSPTHVAPCLPPPHAAGYWAAPVTRTCVSTSSALEWTGSPIVCRTCSPPAINSTYRATYVNRYTYRYACAPGYYGTVSYTTRVCSSSTGGWSNDFPVCKRCEPGYYCTGATARVQCPARYYGATYGLTTSTCSGKCMAGYYCPIGSTSNRQVPCGAVNRYCQAGVATYVTVSTSYYTTPTTAPPTLRTYRASCPSYRSCSNGEIQPGVSFGSTCPAGVTTTQVADCTCVHCCAHTCACMRDTLRPA